MVALKPSVSGTGGHAQPEPSREPEPGPLPPRADLCPTRILQPLWRKSPLHPGVERSTRCMQKEKRFPFPSIPALKGGTAVSPDSDP